MEQLGSLLRTYAQRVFLNQGDLDYVAARSLYRLSLREQFYWTALQALEKYFKAILLFNFRSARFIDKESPEKGEFGHDLEKLCRAVREIGCLRFAPTQRYLRLLEYFTAFGNNRYLSIPTFMRDDVLGQLDKAVWDTRRFCMDVNWILRRPGHPPRPLRQKSVDMIHDARPHGPSRFFLVGGRLEEILKRPASDPVRKALVWANSYYGMLRRDIGFQSRLLNAEWPPTPPTDPALRAKLKLYIRL